MNESYERFSQQLPDKVSLQPVNNVDHVISYNFVYNFTGMSRIIISFTND
jgi:hypothetical protein